MGLITFGITLFGSVGSLVKPDHVGADDGEKFDELSDGIDGSVIIRVATSGHFAETKLTASDAAAGYGFVGAVAANGDTILVGPVETTTMGIISA